MLTFKIIKYVVAREDFRLKQNTPQHHALIYPSSHTTRLSLAGEQKLRINE